MSSDAQGFALETFITNTLKPIEHRHARAREYGMTWRARWSAAEATEARRFLTLGSALGWFDRTASERVLAAFNSSVSPDQSGVNLKPVHMEALERLDAWLASSSFPVRWTDDMAPARARAIGSWQTNVLASSRLGHSLAAEVLAMISCGERDECQATLRKTADGSGALCTNDGKLLEALNSPMSEATETDPNRGLELAASVFHAIRYMATVQDAADMDTESSKLFHPPSLPNPLASASGLSAEDALHMARYWRFNVLDNEWLQNFHTAAQLAATILFRADKCLQEPELAAEVRSFAAVVPAHWEQRALRWGAAFESARAQLG